MIKRIEISGFASISFEISSSMYAASVEDFFRKFSLAGVLKKRFSTVIVVPFGQPISDISMTSPPFITIFVPISLSSFFVINNICNFYLKTL